MADSVDGGRANWVARDVDMADGRASCVPEVVGPATQLDGKDGMPNG